MRCSWQNRQFPEYVNQGKDLGFYSTSNEKLLEDFKQRRHMVEFMFLKNITMDRKRSRVEEVIPVRLSQQSKQEVVVIWMVGSSTRGENEIDSGYTLEVK